MMSQQQRLIYLPLIGTALLGLFVGVYLIAWRRFSRSTPPTKIVKHSVETPSDDVLAYWTADKMRHAKAAPLPQVNELDRGKRPPHTSGPHQV